MDICGNHILFDVGLHNVQILVASFGALPVLSPAAELHIQIAGLCMYRDELLKD
ncbi:hypothetical protein RvY_05562 [Ramazzottius varieornatus]|uniref:Uncharacterized protein n=1 Tax=Ramazzottius varieornatus TaxID=947166 RepID=A0A1D1UYI9_RAMVA|nr:hypothetical protein RvY_05562 [Ramazzottius varieornatus]